MKFTEISLLSALILAAALPALADTQCSNATGDLQLNAWNYAGGAAPMPGMKINETTWTYRGRVIDDSYQLAPDYTSNDPTAHSGRESRLDVSWDESWKTILGQSEGPVVSKEDYSEPVSLRRKDGKPIVNGMSELSAVMICHAENAHGIP